MALPGVPQTAMLGAGGKAAAEWFAWFNTLKSAFDGSLRTGNGSPEGVVAARRGTLFLRLDGGVGSTLYVKQSDDGLTSGWAVLGSSSTLFVPWTTRTFDAADFTGSGTLVWTLTAPDQVTFAYMIRDNTMIVAFSFLTSSVSGVGNILNVLIPGGKIAAKAMRNKLAQVTDNGVVADAFVFVTAGGTTLGLLRNDLANWAASADNTRITGEIIFEVQP